jgi:hypothetical protein
VRHPVDPARHAQGTQTAMADLPTLADELMRQRERTGRARPDLVT